METRNGSSAHKVLHFHPTKTIMFHKENGSARAELTVNNPLEKEFVLLKVKTNAAERYVVKPHIYMLKPKQSKTININVTTPQMSKFIDEINAQRASGKPATAFLMQQWVMPAAAVEEINQVPDEKWVDSLRKLWADQEARDRSAITAAKFTVGIQEETIHETSGVGAGGSPMRMGAAGTGGIDDASDPIPFVHSLPAAAASAPAVAAVPQVPRVPVAVRPSVRDQAGAGSGTPSFTPPYDAAGGDGSAGPQQQGGSGMSVEQAIKMRNDYNALVATVVQLQAEREGLSTAVMKREGEIQKYREKVASLEGAAAGGAGSGASGATGLRQRRGAGGAAVSADHSDDAGNDDTTTAGGEGRGFPLYTVLLIAFVMFLIGRLTSGMF